MYNTKSLLTKFTKDSQWVLQHNSECPFCNNKSFFTLPKCPHTIITYDFVNGQSKQPSTHLFTKALSFFNMNILLATFPQTLSAWVNSINVITPNITYYKGTQPHWLTHQIQMFSYFPVTYLSETYTQN